MAYSVKEAKEQVIKAGKILVESGLIARTWGNISARISDTQFVITPSGLAYETLTEEQIVVVTISDCSHVGTVKPSSEKGIHADAYRLRPEVQFVIHTHQEKASVISITGENLEVLQSQDQEILGEVVPCAAYGISSTKKLRKAVESALVDYPGSKAILMKHHGTLCLGESLEHAFYIAQTLEKVADSKFYSVCGKENNFTLATKDFGKSVRTGTSFLLECDGKTEECNLYAMPENASQVALLHAQIYIKSNIACILHVTDADVIKASTTGKKLLPYLDDLAQIAGVKISSVMNGLKNEKLIVNSLKNKNAVLLYGEGALCTGKTQSDAYAVGIVLRKGCMAKQYADALHRNDSLGYLDANLQRFVYNVKYSKQKK